LNLLYFKSSKSPDKLFDEALELIRSYGIRDEQETLKLLKFSHFKNRLYSKTLALVRKVTTKSDVIKDAMIAILSAVRGRESITMEQLYDQVVEDDGYKLLDFKRALTELVMTGYLERIGRGDQESYVPIAGKSIDKLMESEKLSDYDIGEDPDYKTLRKESSNALAWK
jgi:hypothetical protein